ncbi:MAG: transcriptional regulator [Crocinitomicaceae bacterium]|nr:transcriptional regulator [Crocinitomicaceae bacterium]|tara:strand:+ start:381 stop:1505 length:1125 start_codon:yes stop_codon:yes gene_type:complete
MEGIQMVDLIGQHQKIENELREAMGRVLKTGAFVKGPEVEAFATELSGFTGARHIIPCGNGTDALQIAMMALGIGPGDEVITTGFTFISTVEVVALLGAIPVLVDIDPDSFTIDAAQVEQAITDRTKAIVPVHLFGQMANMSELAAISKKHNVPLIEDNAQAIGAKWSSKGEKTQQSGTIGLMGTTSFFPSKNLGCMGDGGAVLTQDDEMARKCRQIANHGTSKQYHHDVVGINSRLDGLQAAILRVKLQYLPRYIAARQEAAARYDRMLGDIRSLTIPHRTPRSTHVFHQYTLRIHGGKRDALRAHLKSKGIPSGIYYPIPGHAQKAFQTFGYDPAFFGESSLAAAEVLSLPMHTELNEEQQGYICKAIRIFV